MDLFGKAIFALAAFSFCNAVVQESVPTSSASTTTRAPSESTGTSTPASNAPTTKAAFLGNTSASPIVQNKASPTTTSSPQVSTTRNATNSTTGSANALPPTPTTAASMSTSATAGRLPTNTTDVARRNDTHPESISQNTTKSEHDSTRNDFGKPDQVLDTPSYSSIILPVVITLIVITFSVCTLVALYKICWKTTPERQENETEHTSLDKENVKLISVKTTAPQSGEHASQGKNKTRQHDDSSSHLGNKCV